MGIIFNLNKLTPGLYYLKDGRDGLINWDSDINSLQFASSKFEEFENHFVFEFENIKFDFLSDYKFYANTFKQQSINFREIYSEPIDKSSYVSVYNKLKTFLGKPTSIGINNLPSWSNYKICLKIIDYKTEFMISITSESPVHDYRNETKIIRRYNKDEIIYVPNISFSLDYITSLDLKKFIDNKIKPDSFDFQFDWFGEYEKGTFIKDEIVIRVEVIDSNYSFYLNRKLSEAEFKKPEEWINSIVNYLLLENSKSDRYNIAENITEE
jgi:hypothetical protein